MQKLLFDHLKVWIHERPCSGPLNMALDEVLMESLGEVPILRVYRWQGGWGTMGYFGKIEDARTAVSGVPFVRRWTGGGVVDHRLGHTYSLMIPRSHALFSFMAFKRYQRIHESLSDALKGCNVAVELTSEEQNVGEKNCFLHPVKFDLLGSSGEKIAGAGQRRTREGVLHQGAVQADVSWHDFASSVSMALTRHIQEFDGSSYVAEAEVLARKKYPIL